MTNHEVIEELRHRVKPYIGVMPQSTFSNKLRDIQNDLAKPKTVNAFFERFGYIGRWDNYQYVGFTPDKKKNDN